MTQHQKILVTMLYGPAGKWWRPAAFMQPDLGDLFVGYEAGARMSEMASACPYLFETRDAGRFKERRLTLDGMNDWIERLPRDLRETFREELHV